MAIAVDGDGFLPNGVERYRRGYKLTDAGLAYLKTERAQKGAT
jgi:hypothetical protein